MKYLIVLLNLTLLVLISKAQDPNLPSEISKIYPYSGRDIPKVRLWKIDSLKIEFVKDGNLADINTTDVSRIESLNYRIEFDENQKMIIRMYDLIVTETGDTIRGIIKKIAGYNVSYLPAGKDSKTLVTRGYISYILKNPKSDIVQEDLKLTYIDESSQTNDSHKKIITKVDGTTIETPKKDKKTFEENLRSCCLISVVFSGVFIFLGML